MDVEDEEEDDDAEEENRSHFVWKLRETSADSVLCEPAQSNCTHKSHFLWKFTGKSGGDTSGQRFVPACTVELHMDRSQEPFCVEIYGKKGRGNRRTAFCASLRSRTAHGQVTRAILCGNLREKRAGTPPGTAFFVRACSVELHMQVTRAILCGNKSHFVWKFTGKKGGDTSADSVFCASLHNWTHKSHFLWKFTGKQGGETSGQRFVRACTVKLHMDRSQEPFCMENLREKRAGTPPQTAFFCASLHSRTGHTRAIFCGNLREKVAGTPPDSVLCEPAQSNCTWTGHKSYFVWKFTGKKGGDTSEDSVLCEPAQSNCTWTGHKSHFVEIYGKKGRGHLRGQRFVRACTVELHMDRSQEPFCVEIYGKKGRGNRRTAFCASLHSRTAHGQVKPFCVEIYGKNARRPGDLH